MYFMLRDCNKKKQKKKKKCSFKWKCCFFFPIEANDVSTVDLSIRTVGLLSVESVKV